MTEKQVQSPYAKIPFGKPNSAKHASAKPSGAKNVARTQTKSTGGKKPASKTTGASPKKLGVASKKRKPR